MAIEQLPREDGLRELAQRFGLRPVGGRPPLRQYLAGVWERRWFAVTLAVSRVRARNSQDRLGVGWTLLEPLLLAGIYFLIFGVIVGARGGIPNYPAYLVIGVFTFQYMAGTVRAGAASLSGNSGLVRSLQFPRAVLPLVSTLQALILLVPEVVVMLAVVIATGARPTWTWLLLPVIFALQTVFNMGLALVFARVATHSHDFLQGLGFIMRIWFYLSGVIWAVDRVAGYPVLLFVFEVNPGFVYIHLMREALLPEVPPVQYASWPLAIGWAVVLIVVGVGYFWRGEDRYGRHG